MPVFKSGKNLLNLLTTRNKPKLPPNSNPGVYRLTCSCGKHYVGETRLNITTRVDQHHASTNNGNWARSAVADHSKSCHGFFNWQSPENMLKVTEGNFERKVREALEIQYHQCSPSDGGINEDDGKYVSTKFWQPMFKFLRNRRKTTH